MDQCAAERDALLHAARQLPGKTLAEAVEPDGLEERIGLAAIAFLVAPKPPAVWLDDLERQQHVVDDLAPGEQIRVLERHAGDLHRPAYPVAEKDDVAGIGQHQPGHDLHQGRLTAARGAHHRGEFATADAEARVPQGENAAAGAAIGQRDVIDIDGAGHATSPVSSPAQAGDPVVAILPLSHHRDYWMPRLRGARQPERFTRQLTISARPRAVDIGW